MTKSWKRTCSICFISLSSFEETLSHFRCNAKINVRWPKITDECGARTEFYYIEVKKYLFLLFKLVLAYCGFHLFSHFYMSGNNLKHFKLQKNSGRDCRRKTVKMAYICKYDVCNQHCAVVYLFLRLFWHLKKGNLSKHVCRFELFKISIQYPTSMNVHWTRGLRL